MNVQRFANGLRADLEQKRSEGRKIAFVPTMGSLHEGHLSLVRAACALGDVVVLSIFVNPLQFGPTDDFEQYPRDEHKDLELAQGAGVDVVFLPQANEMYRPCADTIVSVGRLGGIVEGASRPGHFDGVATVVVKLLNIVQPDWALFGQKDAQQVAVIKKVVSDLVLPVEIVVCPTIRESDGLALSSRNTYLDPAQRRSATALIEALRAGEEALRETNTDEAAEKVMRDLIATAGLELDYASVVDPETFSDASPEGDRLLVIAARAGKIRLIDNLPIDGTVEG